ncbi:hypothetical protein B0J11DRAFT_434358 [Dendryphion nanum]|uniref:3'(2'),5'-bisphosphate nucleotidase n=1 Tax=Dendryphion nanum TaxID=256645 RepID=A0A9P9DUJ0_9PLEO|nr:hypothetical protein B0J11DRAFT_434358 [Dendryphion nanum]
MAPTDIALALKATHTASLLTKSILRTLSPSALSTTSKPDSTPVTIADFAAQALIISIVRAFHPGDAFLGEESADALRRDEGLAEAVWQVLERCRGEVMGMEAEAEAEEDALSNVQNRPQEMQMQESDDAELTKLLPTLFPRTKNAMLDAIDLGTGTQSSNGRVWVLDPVDGTATFMQGKQYSVCLSLLVDGQQQLGVTGCPNLGIDISGGEEGVFNQEVRIYEDLVDRDGYGVVLSAVKGQGTYVRRMLRNGFGPQKRVVLGTGQGRAVSTLNFVESALGSTTLAQEEHHAVAEEVLGTKWPGTVVWSQQLKYVALALGAADVMVRLPRNKERYTHTWDHSGGILLFQEVGGIVRDLDGKDIYLGQGRRIMGERNYGMVLAMPWAFDAVNDAVKVILDRRTR